MKTKLWFGLAVSSTLWSSAAAATPNLQLAGTLEKSGNERIPIDADLVVESESPASCAPRPPRASPAVTGAKTGGAD